MQPVSRVLVPPVSSPAPDATTVLIESTANGQTAASDPSDLRKRHVTKSGVNGVANGKANGVTTAAGGKGSTSHRRKMAEAPDRTKFVISAWKFFTYSTSTALGLWILFAEGWLVHPELYFKGFGTPGEITIRQRLYYQIGFGHYAYASIAIFFEPRQKDFPLMIIHHAVTLFLVYFSYLWGLVKIGVVILFLHDLSDPVMEFAKMSLYTGRAKLADVMFGTFALIFIYTRNYLFPRYVIHSILKYGYMANGDPVPFGVRAIRDWSVVGLCILEVLHIYWAYLILKMAKKAILNKGVGDDTRNDDD
ncbi:Ceramide synthase 3 [Borealophlyctis nickersoniae]|nr:Ceramide synthase 3 [Borealophlyctis nickersoniae]